MIGCSPARDSASSVASPEESGRLRSESTRSKGPAASLASASARVPATSRRSPARRILRTRVPSSSANRGSSSSSRTLTGLRSSRLRLFDSAFGITLNPTLRNDSGLQQVAVCSHVARPRPPGAGGLRMLQAVLERAAQTPEPEGLAEDVAVHRDVHHQRMALALLDHLVELVDHHVAQA